MDTVPSREGFEISAFKAIFKEVTDLYNAYILYEIRRSQDVIMVPDSTIITAAFACLFTELRFVSTLALFGDIKDLGNGEGKYDFVTHHVLMWKNDLFIIDLVPIDGFTGFSIPQAVIQTANRKRFFVLPKLAQQSWSFEKQVAFDKEVELLVELLTELRQKSQSKMPL